MFFVFFLNYCFETHLLHDQVLSLPSARHVLLSFFGDGPGDEAKVDDSKITFPWHHLPTPSEDVSIVSSLGGFEGVLVTFSVFAAG